MFKINGIIIVVCGALALTLGQVVQGGTDDFESYALTGAWVPTPAGEGWHLGGFQNVAQNADQARIVDDGTGNQYLEIDNSTSPWVGFQGIDPTPMWEDNGPADSASAVTTSGFDFRGNAPALGSEFVTKFSRHPAGNLYYDNTWEFGIRVGSYGEMGSPFGPGGGPANGWDATGTGVYLKTYQGSGVNTVTDVPGFGEGVFIVPGVQGTPAGIIAEWYSVEIEEDNTTQQTRARMYLRSSSPGAEDGWTPWQDHQASIDYAGDSSQWAGFLGGNMDLDNFYSVPEPATMALMGLGAMTMLLRRRAA